jgi:hypothetical protein
MHRHVSFSTEATPVTYRYPPADKQYIFNFFYEVHIEGGSVCFLFSALGCLR